MKAKITRILAIVLAFSMIVCCFSACGGNDDEETTTIPSIEFPTNPQSNGSEDSFVNDGPNSDLNTNTGVNSNTNVGTNTGVNSNTSTNTGTNYNPGNTQTNNNTNNNNSNNSSFNNNPLAGTVVDPDYLESEVEHFLTHVDTPEERQEMLALAGYKYDAGQDIFYTHLNPWQRYAGFTDIYDQAAPLTNMWYLTLKIDFKYDDLLWRLQWWKGQYGILEGAELGVYTKDPSDTTSAFYACASDEQLLTMVLDYYHSWEDYKNGNRLFTRAEQEHWWLTGFKFGVVSPKKCVVRATLYAYDDEMADGIEAGLQNLTDGKNQLSGKGFVPYKSGITEKDFYIRNGNRFSVVWYEAGYLNYNTQPENPEGSDVTSPIE